MIAKGAVCLFWLTYSIQLLFLKNDSILNRLSASVSGDNYAWVQERFSDKTKSSILGSHGDDKTKSSVILRVDNVDDQFDWAQSRFEDKTKTSGLEENTGQNENVWFKVPI